MKNDDPHDLNRFVQAQQDDHESALAEITAGRKRTHWMWFIFPQIDGLAFSEMSRHYSIKGIDEARAYLDHPILGARLLACAQAVLSHEGLSAKEIFGYPDDLKLRSSATLFASVSPPGSMFHRLLENTIRAARTTERSDSLVRGLDRRWWITRRFGKGRDGLRPFRPPSPPRTSRTRRSGSLPGATRHAYPDRN